MFYICKYIDGEFACGWVKDSDYESFENREDAEEALEKDELSGIDEFLGFCPYVVLSDEQFEEYQKREVE